MLPTLPLRPHARPAKRAPDMRIVSLPFERHREDALRAAAGAAARAAPGAGLVAPDLVPAAALAAVVAAAARGCRRLGRVAFARHRLRPVGERVGKRGGDGMMRVVKL